MLKSLLKVFLGSIVVTVIFIIISLIAAPFVVRQEQVLSFLEKKVKLPEGQKIKFASKVNFGIFPYSFVEFARAEIVSNDGTVKTIEDFLLGFTFDDLLSRGISFDFNAKLSDNVYKGNLKIEDFKNFRVSRKSPITLNLLSPIQANLQGVIEFKDNSKKLTNFVIVHKNTTAKGNLNVGISSDKKNSFEGDVVINSANIDEVRRILDFKNFNDEFTQLSGKGVIKATFSTNGSNEIEYKKNLKSQGDFIISNAEIYGFDLNEFISNPTGYKYVRNNTKKTQVDNISGVFNVLNGVAGLTSIKANNQNANIIANGNLNIVTDQIDLMSDISTIVGGQPISLPVRLLGDVKKPKIIPNVSEGLARNLPSVINNPKVQEMLNSEQGKKVLNKVNKALEDMGGVDGLMNMLNGK